MAARLPIPGKDEGAWGDILNEYLSTTLASDGTLKNNSVTASQLAPDAVQTGAMSDSSVTGSKLADDTITEDKLDPSVRSLLHDTGSVTDLSASASSTTVTVASSTGNDAVLSAATAGSAGVLTAADKVKLDGVATGATANNTDANLLNRANHTGTQAVSTVTGLQATLDAKMAKDTARGDSDTGPVWQTHFTGTLDTNDRNVAEHYVNGTMVAWLNEWGAMRGTPPYQDALFRAVRANGDGAGSGQQPAFHLNDRRTGAVDPTIWARTWAGTLQRNGINMADTYVRNSSSDPIPPNLPAGTVVITLS